MSIAYVNNLTPSRKRKRNSEKLETNTVVCFTNAAFSSTPKKVSGRRRLISHFKENQMRYSNSCMEVKSIAELVAKKNQTEVASPTEAVNSKYEVQRKPPKKKKKRETAVKEACFENPALNLEFPEKHFNPYEVKRQRYDIQEDKQKCFINKALNIKGQDSTLSVRNPFEISRNNKVTESYATRGSVGVENFALEDTPASTSLKIGIPFTPTVNCRIDFNNVSLSQLTPSKLLLGEKLVFSPVLNSISKPKRSLDTISEESPSTSIGKELDRYQLELENSINEAKLLKNDEKGCIEKKYDEERVFQLQLKVEKKKDLNQCLTQILESDEYETDGQTEDVVVCSSQGFEHERNQVQVKREIPEITEAAIKTIVLTIKNAEKPIKSELEFASEGEEEDLDFEAPTPFIRSYRRDFSPKSHLKNSKESLRPNSSAKSFSESITEKSNHLSVKSLICKSIRKIIPHHKQNTENIASPCEFQTTDENNEDEVKQCTLVSHIMSSIRHSLRRKPKSALTEIDNKEAEISIIDVSERKMKLKSSVPRNDYARIEELTNEKKNLLRSGGLRRSIMKTIFQKQEEYSFQK